MSKRCVLVLLVVIFGYLHSSSARDKHPHYVFELPNGYVGWVQIIFNDPQASPFPIEKGLVTVDVPESGIVRTSNLRIHASLAPDEFYYKGPTFIGASQNHRVPIDYFLPGIDHGGFGVMDTGGKGLGYSWFLFIGPPELRAKVPFADWNRVVEDYRKSHGGKARIEFSGSYPTPGRMESGTGSDLAPGIAPTTRGPHL
jgi:hypothetical protein